MESKSVSEVVEIQSFARLTDNLIQLLTVVKDKGVNLGISGFIKQTLVLFECQGPSPVNQSSEIHAPGGLHSAVQL